MGKVERLVAKLCSIRELATGNYIIKEGVSPNHIITPGGEISRANIIATVVNKEKQNIIMDDGTGTIEARAFENKKLFEEIDVGDTILLIGRPREYKGARYLVAEIVKRLDSPTWLLLRKEELKKIAKKRKREKREPEEKREREKRKNKGEKEEGGKAKKTEKREEKREEKDAPEEKRVVNAETILQFIKEKDNGEGVPVEEILSKTGCDESTINLLLAEGEIYEKRPGRLKVL